MHFLLDDTQLVDYPQVEIGYLLKSEREASLVNNVTGKILEVFDEIGNAELPHLYLNHPKWLEVVESARITYDVLISKSTSNEE